MTKVSGHLSGHTLKHEGSAYDNGGSRIMTYGVWSNTGLGRAKCSCGVLSEPLPSVTKRKAWHKAHKDEIRTAK